MKKLYDESELFDAIKDVSLEAYNNTKSKDPQVLAKEAWRIMSTVRFTKLLMKPRYKREGNTLIEENTEEVNFSGLVGKRYLGPAELLKKLIDLSVIPQTLPFEHHEDMKKFVKACKVLFPNVDAYNVGTCLTNFGKVLENIWANCDHPEARKQQVAFYQYSSLGGTGKSRFHERLHSFCEKYGINCAESNIGSRWIGSEFSINLISTVGEFFPPKSSFDAEKTIININNIVDNTYYTVEYKQQQPVETLSKTTLFINSNKLPFDSNTRRYGVVRYNERPYNSYSAEEHAKYFADDATMEQALKDAFESVPFGVEFVDEVQRRSSTYTELVLSARRIIESARFESFDPRSITPREWAKRELELTTGMVTPETLKAKMYSIRSTLREAVANGDIKPVKRINGNTDYSLYDLQEISQLVTAEDAQSTELDNITNPLEATAFAFDYFINLCSPSTPTDPSTPSDPTTPSDPSTQKEENETKLAPTDCNFDFMTDKTPVCKDKYSKPNFTATEKTQFLVTASYKPEYIQEVNEGKAEINRCGENMIPEYFVYESDELDIEEQKRIAEKLLNSSNGKYVRSVTDSGNRSLHILVKISNGKALTEDFKLWWKRCADILFGLDVAEKMDKACASVGRLTRFPNGTRDNGKKQQCLYYNPDSTSFEFTDDEVNTIMWAKKIQQAELEKKLKKVVYGDKSEIERLTSYYNANPEKWELVYKTLVENRPIPSGSDMIGNIKKLETANMPELRKAFANLAHQQHPSNIGYKHIM